MIYKRDPGFLGIPIRDDYCAKMLFQKTMPHTIGVGFTDHHGFHRKRVNVTCSHITFVGKGKDQTTIRGGFEVTNQQHVKFEELTITNQSGHGLYLRGSETNVDVLKCVVKECRWTGMYVYDGATVTATQCEFMENGSCGVYCSGVLVQIQKQD